MLIKQWIYRKNEDVWVVNLADSYFISLASVAGTIISITGTLFIAYVIYLNQKRDEYNYLIQNNVKKLNEIISRFLNLEEMRYPPSMKIFPYGRQYLTLHNLPPEYLEWVFKSPAEMVIEEFKKAEKRSHCLLRERPCIAKRRPFITAAERYQEAYGEVSHYINDLVIKIYAEFQIPLDSSRSNNRMHISPFINYNFPEDISNFKEWSKRCKLYYTEIGLFYTQIKNIIERLSRIYTKDNDINCYKAVFEILPQIEDATLSVDDDIKLYESCRISKNYKYIFLGLASMILGGLLVPLYMLQPHFKFMLVSEVDIVILTGIGLFAGGILTIFALFREITAKK